MKLTNRDIGLFLKSPDREAKAALLYGPDTGLVRERSKTIATAILGKDSDPFNKVELSVERIKSDPAILRDELGALSLMGGRRLVIIQGAGEKISAVIAGAFEGLATTTYLIIEAEELSPSSSLRQLFEKQPDFAALACYREEGRNLEETIRTTLAELGLRAQPDALRYLAGSLGNDRGVTTSELAKIAVYMGTEKEVTLEIALQLTGHNSAETMEDLCHCVAGGEAGKAQALLARLLHEGEQPIAALRSLMRHFQRLDLARAHTSAGMPAEQAIAALRPPVFFKYAPLMKRELGQWNARSGAQVLNLLLRTEKEMKSGTMPPALLLSRVVQQTARMAA